MSNGATQASSRAHRIAVRKTDKGSKASRFLWHLARPSHWAHARELVLRKFRPRRDTAKMAEQARAWAAAQAVSLPEALRATGLLSAGDEPPQIPEETLDVGRARARECPVVMGGGAHVHLLYAAVRLARPRRILESGVGFGWSSLAILSAIRDLSEARLVSVDMPYPKRGNERWVGAVVPADLRDRWELIREPDRNGLPRAIRRLGETIDLCHYDSDKSYWGRNFGLKRMWDALEAGGILICDDIQDNCFFKDFVERNALDYSILEFEDKWIGIIRKP